MRSHSKRIGAISTVAVLAFALSACGDDEAEVDANNGQQEEPAAPAPEAEDEPTEEPAPEPDTEAETTEEPAEEPAPEAEPETTDEPTEEPGDDAAEGGAGGGDGSSPDWAAAVNTDGELLTTAEVGDLEVEIYQVDVVQSADDSITVDADTEEPLIAAGDDIVYINFVVTNTSDAPVDLGLGLVSTSAKYDDWAYLGGMPSVTDREQIEGLGLTNDGFAEGFANEAPYELGAGQSFNVATNFLYEQGGNVTFDIDYDQFDENGDRISDSGGEVEVEATLN